MLKKIQMIDQKIAFYFLGKHQHKWLNDIMMFISSCGDFGMSWLVIILITNIYSHTRAMSIKMLIALIIATLVGQVTIKSIVKRKRPCQVYKDVDMLIPVPSDLSFPSGHTMASFACSTVMIFFFPLFGMIGMIYAALTGLSRLYLFVHYLSDVLCGMCLGIIVGIVVYIL